MAEFMNLENLVDLYTGKAAFPVHLAGLPGRNGLGFQLNISYNSNAQNQAQRWNMEAPTGVLGLGWMAPFDMIFIDMSRLHCFEPVFFLLKEGVITRLLYVESGEHGELIYKTEEYSFRKIVYYPQHEKWEISDEDGDIYTYGDAKSNRNTVQWLVEWNGWLGASSRTEGQIQSASAWNLSTISNRFSDAVTFYYSNVDVPVGDKTGLCYTQASYLKDIRGVRGDSFEFHYLDKDSSEYPCLYPSSSFAYQPYVEKAYLDAIFQKSPEGILLSTHRFDYGLMGEGSLKKRILVSIKEIYPGDKNLPGAAFSYYGQHESDGVSAGNIYNSGSEALYGAIKQITVPKGGTITYKYGTIQIGNSLRNIPIASPESPGVRFTDPRFYFEDDYAVATWYGNNSTMAVQTYLWDGRWLKKEFKDIQLQCPYDRIGVKVSERFFTVHMAQSLYTFYKDISKAGEWMLGSLNLQSGKEAISPDYAVYAHAEGEGYMMGVGGPSYGNLLDAEIVFCDLHRKWRKKKFNITLSLYVIDELTLYPGKDYAVLRAVTRMAARKSVQFSVIRWNKNFDAVESHNWGITFLEAGADVPVPALFNNLVAVGLRTYRFDGVNWNYKDISTVTSYTGPKDREQVLFGEDIALRKIHTSNSCIYELIGYNPDSGQWAIPGGMSIDSTNAHLGCAVLHTQGEPVRYVILAGKLWYRETEGSWKEKFTLPDGLSEKDAETLQFPSYQYFMHQVNTGQSSVKTILYFIDNGEVVPQRMELPGESMWMPGKTFHKPAGRTSFVSYTEGSPVGGFFLRRVVSGDAKDKQTGYIIKSKILNNGYMDIVSSYRFDDTTACIDTSGHIYRFNKASVYLGTDHPDQTTYGYTQHFFYNGLTPDESPAAPYPANLDYTNAADYYSAVKGLKYSTRIYDCSDSLVSSISDFWWVYINDSGNNAPAFYVRKRRQEKTLDGVTGAVEYLYSRHTGLLIEKCMFNHNTWDEPEKYIQQFTYWWEVYDSQRSLNLLTSVVQVTCKTKNMVSGAETVTSINVITWREDWGYGKGRWFPYQSFCALRGDVNPFDAWNEGEIPPADEWLEIGTNEFITPSGMILESKNVEGSSTSRIYDKAGFFVTAEIQNASFANNDLSYLGFEPYEDTGCWGSLSSNTLADHIVDWDYYTGSQCLQLTPIPIEGVFRPNIQHRAYVFGCNAKVESGFDPNKGKAMWEIAIFRELDNTEVGTAMILELSTAKGNWDYFQKTIDLDAVRERNHLPPDTALYFTIKGYSLNQAKFCLVDNLRVIPSDAVFGAAVYEPSDLRMKALLDNNGQAVKIIYNEFLRPSATVNARQNVNGIAIDTYSRNLFGVDVFKQQFPNMNLLLGTLSDSRYMDFHDDSLEGWKFAHPGDWRISDGKLTYTGTSSEPLGEKAILDALAYTNFAFRFTVQRQSGSPSANVTAGDGYYFVRWEEDGQNAQWKLMKLGTDSAPEVLATFNGMGFKEEWIFIVVDGFVMFYADGVPLFCHGYERPAQAPQDYGKPMLYIDKPGAFDDVIILREPQLSMRFEDGFGTVMQSMSLAGKENSGVFGGEYSVAWRGAFFDALGRIQYICNPMTSKVALSTYGSSTGSAEIIEADADTYLYDSQGNKLSKSGYLSADRIDYRTQIYEPSPLSRVSKVLSPRNKESDAALFTTDLIRTCSSSIEKLHPSKDGSENRFFVEKASKVQCTDTNHVKNYIENIVMYDWMGRPVRELEGKEGAYKEKRYIYDPSGNLSVIQQPNYFDAPPGAQQSGFTDTMEYTFSGLLKKRVLLDSKTVEYIYDKAGKLRFVLDSEGAGQNPQRIVYVKYDTLKRVVENGYISDPNYPWDTDGGKLQRCADNPRFPIIEPALPQDADYAAGRWKRRFFYDRDRENPDTKYLVGRLWKVQINNGAETADEEYYKYDALGNIISKSVKTGRFDGKGYEFVYRYNNQGQVISLTYPSCQGEAPLKVGYYYDRLGRQACVGEVVDQYPVVDPSNPPTPPELRYASFDYDSSGLIIRESLNNSPDPSAAKPIIREYGFNNEGMLQKISDNYFEEVLDYYVNGGYGGFKYYDGNIASLSFDYKIPANQHSTLAPYNYQFQYDVYGRMINGIHSLESAWDVRGSTDSPSYDANGNIRKQTRGATTRSYQYAAPEKDQVNNRVLRIESSIHAVIDFEGLSLPAVKASDWSWGSSNGGTSKSGIYTDDKHSGTQCLKLAGGSLGHYEFLLLKTFLAPVTRLKLTYWKKTCPGFDPRRGEAGWFIRIYAASGDIFTKKIKTVTAADDWTKDEEEINLLQLFQSLGRGEEISYAILELRNSKEVSDQETQAYLLLDDISVTGNDTSQNYEYNDNGDVTRPPHRGIELVYDPVSGLPATIQMEDAGSSLEFSYDACNQRMVEERKSADSSEAYKKLYLNGLNDRPLMEIVEREGIKKAVWHIYSEKGLLASRRDEKWLYLIKDHLGSTRMLVDETGGITNWYDYMPFGELTQTGSGDSINYLYTGQEYDRETGLYNYKARLYDSDSRRFYAVDPAGQYVCPYVYVGNNPVNRIDPTGCMGQYVGPAVSFSILAFLGYHVWQILGLCKRHNESVGKIPLNRGKIIGDYLDSYVSYEWKWGEKGYKKRARIGILQEATDSNVLRLYNPVLNEEKQVPLVLTKKESEGDWASVRKFNYVLMSVNGKKEIRLSEVNPSFEDRDINIFHSELAKGLRVDCAGELIIHYGTGESITVYGFDNDAKGEVYLHPKTGHYYKTPDDPTYREFDNCPNIVLEEMKRLGYTNIGKVRFQG